MTNQELFDKVVAHLRAQNARAVVGHSCMYRDPDGKMCAAGCLISDENYSSEIEGRNLSWPSVRKSLLASGVAENQLGLVQALQQVHDIHLPCHWQKRLACVARENYLILPAAP